jgi:aryl-alcohol dehydrogenase
MIEATAAVVWRPGDLWDIERIVLPAPASHQVLVKIAACGLCHTDDKARLGQMPMPLPAVLGHEGSGTIAAVGSQVETFSVGDRVLLGWPYCGECAACHEQQPRYCDALKPLAFSGQLWQSGQLLPSQYQTQSGQPLYGHFFGQSALATHALVAASSLVKIPTDFPLNSAGPLACGLATGAGAVLHQTPVRQCLAVVGCGAVGLGAVMAARIKGWSDIVVIDQHQDRLALAQELGATQTIQTDGRNLHEQLGARVDLILECTGLIPLVEQAIDCIGPLGVCLLLGGGLAGERFSAEQRSVLWGKRIEGVLGGGGTSEALLTQLMEYHLAGEFPFDRLLKFYPLAEINQALSDVHSGQVIKPVIVMPDTPK